jgi:predicted solute-binding protein
MMGTRPKDGGEWMQMSRALVDVGEKAIRAAASHNPQAVFDVGAEVYEVCTSCHTKYVQEPAASRVQD